MTGQEKQQIIDAIQADVEALTMRLIATPNQTAPGAQAMKILRLIAERNEALATLESLPVED